MRSQNENDLCKKIDDSGASVRLMGGLGLIPHRSSTPCSPATISGTMLGRAHGAVYRARHHPVAMCRHQRFHPEVRTTRMVATLQARRQAARPFRHPKAVRFHLRTAADGTIDMVDGYVEGLTLDRILDAGTFYGGGGFKILTPIMSVLDRLIDGSYPRSEPRTYDRQRR